MKNSWLTTLIIIALAVASYIAFDIISEKKEEQKITPEIKKIQPQKNQIQQIPILKTPIEEEEIKEIIKIENQEDKISDTQEIKELPNQNSPAEKSQ